MANVAPEDTLALLRTAGNRTAARAVSTPGLVQRVIVSNNNLIATKSWIDKIKAAAGESYEKQEVLKALAAYSGQGATKLVTKPKGNKAISDAYAQLTYYYKTAFYQDFESEKEVHVYDHALTKGAAKPIPQPDLVWTGSDDLAQQLNPAYACVLISLWNVKGYPAIRGELGLAAKNGESAQVSEMHRKIYHVDGIRYDDWSGHVPLYQRFGLTFHNIRTTWGNVHKRLTMTAGDYILALDGHMLAVTVNQDLTNEKANDGQAGWYTSARSTVQVGYARDFDANHKIDYLFSA